MKISIFVIVLLLWQTILAWPRMKRIRPPAIKNIVRCKASDRDNSSKCLAEAEGVCGYSKHYPRQTYNSGCEACKENRVFGYSAGKCLEP